MAFRVELAQAQVSVAVYMAASVAASEALSELQFAWRIAPLALDYENGTECN